MDKKVIPIGISDFKSFNDKNYYYVDKTLMIKDILDDKALVTLFTRPRRFGKTLNLSMLKYFFEKTQEDNSYLFKDLNIWKTGDKYKEYQGKYPVINLDFKSVEGLSWKEAYEKAKVMITSEYIRHGYLLDSDVLNDDEKNLYNKLKSLKFDANETDYMYSIKNLCVYLEKYHKQKPIILIDEYDVPLQRAYLNDYYKEAINFFRGMLQDALKTNNSLEFAVITGCLRISKESIFTGLNNLDINSILDKQYSEHFGFTQEEVDEILKYYNLEAKRGIIKDWYNGYQFGMKDIYNPWSVLKCIKNMTIDLNKKPEAYWVNTSGNDIVKKLIKNADAVAKNEIEILINGGAINKALNANITYNELEENIDNIWSMLFFTGYLTYTEEKREEEDVISYYSLKIPNKELMCIYKVMIKAWFDDNIKQINFDNLYQNMLDGKDEEISDEISSLLLENISFYDANESFYHGMLIGIFSKISKYRVFSNLESGKGRSDIILEPTRVKQPAIVIEIKVTSGIEKLGQKCQEALKQIDIKNYDTYLKKRGFDNVIKYGMAFCSKRCLVKKNEKIDRKD